MDNFSNSILHFWAILAVVLPVPLPVKEWIPSVVDELFYAGQVV